MENHRYQDINYRDIGVRIRAARKALGLTQQALAERVDMAPSNISHVERGTTKLSVQSLIHIANALDTSVDALLCDNLQSATAPYHSEVAALLEDCTAGELRVLCEVLRATKDTIRKNISLR